MASDRIASSVTTPPAFRITCASPTSRPSARAGSSLASMQARTATCVAGGMARSPLPNPAAYLSLFARNSSVTVMADLLWMRFGLQGRGLDGGQPFHRRTERPLEPAPRVVGHGTGDHGRHADLREGFRAAHDVIRGRVGLEVAVQDRDLDLVGVAPDGVAVPAEHVQLVCHLIGAAEEVARVGVLRDEPEGLPLATTTDQNARAG